MFLPNTYRTRDVRNLFLQERLHVRDHGGDEVAGTVELIGTSFIADEDTIFGEPDFSYITREILWYQSGSRNVHDFPGGAPAIWHDISSRSGRINSNYGWMMYSRENGLQLENVIATLKREPSGRRAVAIYTRPTMHDEWNLGGMRDFACTNAVCYYRRKDQVHAIVQMRSNDAIFGYRNDWHWQQTVLLEICQRIGAEPGTMVWQAGSLHVYARHYHLIDHYHQTDEYRVSVKKPS